MLFPHSGVERKIESPHSGVAMSGVERKIESLVIN